MINFSTFFDEFKKIAASRLDREVAQGNVRYSDAVPGAKNKAQAQEAFYAHEPVAPAQLERTRQLKGKAFDAQMAQGEYKGMDLKKTTRFGAGPSAGQGSINVPSESGRFLRTADKPFAKTRLSLSTLAGLGGKAENAKHLLTKEKPVDRSLNLGTLQHELGEADEMTGTGTLLPHASHMGTTPLVKERLALHGDPEAHAVYDKLRSADPGEVSVQKAMRHVGATPGAPIPVGGKQHAALDRIVGKTFTKDHKLIGQSGKQTAMTLGSMAGRSIGYKIPDVQGLLTEGGAVAQSVKGHLASGNYQNAAKDLWKNRGVARKALDAVKWAR